jgi:hypothetical protein
MLMGARRYKEARAVLNGAMTKFPKSIEGREKAIRLYADCGDNEIRAGGPRIRQFKNHHPN